MNTTNDEFLLFENLTVRSGDQVILDQQSLSIRSGQITVLMGPSGVGKSVLADVLFHTSRAHLFSVHGRIGNVRSAGVLVFQEGGGLPHLSVENNLRLLTSDSKRLARTIEKFSLPKTQLAATLSGGQKRRLAAASALLADRSLLWLDEPETGLDIIRVQELCNLLKQQVNEYQTAIVLVTHQLSLAEELSDRIVFLDFRGHLHDLSLTSRPNLKDQLARLSASSKREAPQSDHTRDRTASILTPHACLDIFSRSIPLFWLLATRRQSIHTFIRTFRLAAIDGILFYSFIGFIFGWIFTFILYLALPAATATPKMVAEIGPDIVTRFSPAFTSILVASCSGASISSWIGHMALSRQLDTIRALGVDVYRTIHTPAWWGLTFAGITNCLCLAISLTATFVIYMKYYEVLHQLRFSSDRPSFSFDLLSDFMVGLADPYLIFGFAARILCFSMLVATITIAAATAPKAHSSEVAAGITKGIVWCAILITTFEMVILAVNQSSLLEYL